MSRPPLPPFTAETAAQKARMADDSGHWFRSYGNENWEFAEDGLMAVRHASINDVVIGESDRKYHWPLGARPLEHPSLSDLGL
jgi:nuclear transport factor 2 (NTF2) superfamily protein